jgi:hypothetical protein
VDLRADGGRLSEAGADRERALLLLCCRIEQSAATRAQIAALAGSAIDWRRLSAMVAQNSIAPLVAARLLDPACRPLLPAEVARQYALAQEATALRNLYLTDRLHRIVEVLARAGIPALALKGPVIAQAAYRDLSLRAFGDLDVLVRRHEVPRAIAALAGLGYLGRSWNAEAFASGFFPDTSIDLAGPGVVLDLHWSLSADYFPFAPDDEGVWRNAIEIELAGRPVRTLSRDDALLFHACHGAKHGWVRMQAVSDLGFLCASAAPAWDSLLERAARIGSRTMLLVGLHLCRSLLALPAGPPQVEAVIDEPRVKSLSERVAQRFFATRAEGNFSEWGMALRSIDSARGRLLYFASRILKPRLSDRAFLPLPRPLYPLYYLARPFSLPLKHRDAIARL